MRLIESTAFDKYFSPEAAEHLKNIILTTNGKTVTHDTAFGVFLGYSFGLEADGKPSEQFRAELDVKMRLDIKNYVSYIVEKIKKVKMD